MFLGVDSALIFRLRLFSTLTIFGILYTLGNSSKTLMALAYLMPHEVLEQSPQSWKTAADGGDTHSTWGLEHFTVLPCPPEWLELCRQVKFPCVLQSLMTQGLGGPGFALRV